MKSLLSILTLALGLAVASASPAAARGSVPYGTQHSPVFMADLGGVGRQQQDVALCHHTARSHVVFLGYWVCSQGYVKSLTACEGNSYLRF